jgi:hypothetical protein
MPQAAAGIGHGVGFPSNGIEQWDVAIMAFMECLETEETSRRATRLGGLFALPPDCSDIIRGVVDGCFSDVKGLVHYVMLGDAGG